MNNYIQTLKYKWQEFDLRLFIISLMYRGRTVYVDVIEDYPEYEEVDHGEIIEEKTTSISEDGGFILRTYEDGYQETIEYGSNKYGTLGLDKN